MLKHWQSHQEYLFFLHEAKVNFDSSLRKRRKRYSFFAMIAGINIHLDARLKMNRLTVAA